jgi:hypothetical protein
MKEGVMKEVDERGRNMKREKLLKEERVVDSRKG